MPIPVTFHTLLPNNECPGPPRFRSGRQAAREGLSEGVLLTAAGWDLGEVPAGMEYLPYRSRTSEQRRRVVSTWFEVGSIR